MKKWLKMFLDHKGFRKKTVLSGPSGIKLELTFGAKKSNINFNVLLDRWLSWINCCLSYFHMYNQNVGSILSVLVFLGSQSYL